jgi:peptidoglycan/LPS O-acetylase OafA/YrhL
MFLFTLLVQLVQGTHPVAVDFWSMVFFFQNYVPSIWGHGLPEVWNPTWLLAVEEHFYILVAGLFWILKSRASGQRALNVDVIPSVFFYTALSCLLLRIVTWGFIPYYTSGLISYPTHLRIDSLLFGVLLAYYWHMRWTAGVKVALRKWRLVFLALGICLLITDFVWRVGSGRNFCVFASIFFYVGAGCLLLASLTLDSCRVPAVIKGAAWLGKHSYSVYLWHMVILEYLILPGKRWAAAPLFPGAYFIVFFVSSWLIGVGLAKLIEIPSLRLRDRLFPSFQRTTR